MHEVLTRLEPTPLVLVEYPRFAMVKRRADGSVDFVSPVPCPYNYGCIPGLTSGDGDTLDAVVLGPRLALGTRVRVPVVAVVDFTDNGDADPKVICSHTPLTPADTAGLHTFFTIYAAAKRALARVRGVRGPTGFAGLLTAGPWQR